MKTVRPQLRPLHNVELAMLSHLVSKSSFFSLADTATNADLAKMMEVGRVEKLLTNGKMILFHVWHSGDSDKNYLEAMDDIKASFKIILNKAMARQCGAVNIDDVLVHTAFLKLTPIDDSTKHLDSAMLFVVLDVNPDSISTRHDNAVIDKTITVDFREIGWLDEWMDRLNSHMSHFCPSLEVEVGERYLGDSMKMCVRLSMAPAIMDEFKAVYKYGEYDEKAVALFDRVRAIVEKRVAKLGLSFVGNHSTNFTISYGDFVDDEF